MDTSKIEQNPVVKAIGLQALHLHQAIYERTDGRRERSERIASQAALAADSVVV